ncbi:uncharacterized protein [Procambarus clarkii]|uniref:uncharacterized protein n=1 Tax=Procambarus clarkii TaxID=6728 RepID=UPI003743F8A1
MLEVQLTLSPQDTQPEDTHPEDCGVCWDTYDEAERRPRTLPCGHTFCSLCLERAITYGTLKCPNCCVKFRAATATQFPVSYCVEALVRKLIGTKLISGPPTPCQASPGGISRKLWSLMQEEKISINRLIARCEETLCQLGEYRGQLGDWKTHHLQLQDRLNGLVEQNMSAMRLLDQEDASVAEMTTRGQEEKTHLHATLGSLDTPTTAHRVITAIARTEQVNQQAEDWLQTCQDVFPDINTVRAAVKVQETIREALEMMTTEAGVITAVPVHLGDSDSTIMEKVGKITGGISQLTVEDLRRMRAPVRRLVETGLVLAVQEDQDGRRSARITLQDGQLCLHPLLPQPPPTHAHTLKYEDVVEASSSTLAFLDLKWAGSTRGRVTIQLTLDTGLARQFMLLCTGELGHSYTGTKLLWVWNKGQPEEWVVGGDYESNDGEGGASLLPDLKAEYESSGAAGAVFSRWGLWPARSAQFVIITRDCAEGGPLWPCVFGEVVSGLEVVRAAANHSEVTEVTVANCGVVLTL